MLTIVSIIRFDQMNGYLGNDIAAVFVTEEYCQTDSFKNR